MADPQLPRPQSPLVDRTAFPTPEWYDFFRDLLAVASEQTTADAAIAELQAAVAALQNAEPDLGQILGNFSVEVQGLLGQAVALSLRGDVLDPGTTYYYGTNAGGTKGWYPVADTLLEGTGITLTVDGTTGEITVALADLADGGGGSFLLFTRDAQGRVSGTSAGDAGDVPYDDAGNTYVTGANVQAALDSADTALAGKQPLDATLTALAGANWALNALPIGTGADTVSQVAFAANRFPARASTGNLEAKTITDDALLLLADADVPRLGTVNTWSATQTIAGNLTFSGTGRRILADLSNGTQSNRTYFQTSTANSSSTMGVIPSGTGTTALLQAQNSSDADNASAIQIRADAAAVYVNSTKTGTGTTRNMGFGFDGTIRATLDTTGRFGLGVVPSDAKLQTQETSAGAAVSAARFANNSDTANTAVRVSLDPANFGFNTRDCILEAVTNGSNQITLRVLLANASNPVETFRLSPGGQVGIGGSSYGSGVGAVVFVANAAVAPTTNPTGGFIAYGDSGSAKIRTPGGNVVTIAPNTAPSVTGSRGGNAALASLLTTLAAAGIIADNTTA